MTASDGCGYISEKLANEVSKKYKYKEFESHIIMQSYSAFQIRIGGAKGVLLRNPLLEGNII